LRVFQVRFEVGGIDPHGEGSFTKSMLRLLLRALGLFLLASAFITLIIDVMRSIAAATLHVTPIGETLMALDPGRWAFAQGFIERHLHPFVWNPILVELMRLPVWFGAGVAGGLVSWFAKKPGRKIGFWGR
jgi:hypothetical protein